MKSLFVLITLVMLLLMMATMTISAQDEISCNPADVMADIDAAYTTFGEDTSADSDATTTFGHVQALYEAVGEVYSACDEARYQEYIAEGSQLLEDLREGGYVIYVRHAATDTTQSDTDLASCETQRNLSDQGRLDAAHIGEWWTTYNVPVGDIISTEYCRTQETAQLAFGEPMIMEKEQLVDELEWWLSVEPAEGTNTIIVGHVDLLEDATGIRIPEEMRFNEGDAIVYLPLGGPMGDQGYELVTRISFQNWSDLARISAAMQAE